MELFLGHFITLSDLDWLMVNAGVIAGVLVSITYYSFWGK